MSNVSPLHMTQLAGKETILNKLSKLIELTFISTLDLNSLLLKIRSPTNQISTCPASFLVTLKFSSLLIMKSLLNVNLYTWSAFISLIVCLGKTLNSWYKYSELVVMSKILRYAQNFKCVQLSVFPSGKHIFPILWQILKLEIMEYLIHYMLSLKCEHLYFM